MAAARGAGSDDDDGALVDPSALAAAATAFSDQLTWWARALRAARTEVPA